MAASPVGMTTSAVGRFCSGVAPTPITEWPASIEACTAASAQACCRLSDIERKTAQKSPFLGVLLMELQG